KLINLNTQPTLQAPEVVGGAFPSIIVYAANADSESDSPTYQREVETDHRLVLSPMSDADQQAPRVELISHDPGSYEEVLLTETRESRTTVNGITSVAGGVSRIPSNMVVESIDLASGDIHRKSYFLVEAQLADNVEIEQQGATQSAALDSRVLGPVLLNDFDIATVIEYYLYNGYYIANGADLADKFGIDPDLAAAQMPKVTPD
ncbi:MAG: hypothetical protein JJU11_09075, partial [Candidatus Sumerlaeia bacterium]|nr:hypothetical protein [Candidatus Sumerlaeia bacterium]